jgi:hypothetical protein
MTVPVSTVPGVIAQLLTDIQAAAVNDSYYSSMTICLGTPGPDISDEVIYLSGAANRQVMSMSLVGNLGTNALRESYDLEVTVSVFSNDEGSTVVNRAWTLVGYVETAVRNDPNCANQVEVIYPSGSTGGEPIPIQNPAGVQVDIGITIHVEATI